MNIKKEIRFSEDIRLSVGGKVMVEYENTTASFGVISFTMVYIHMSRFDNDNSLLWEEWFRAKSHKKRDEYFLSEISISVLLKHGLMEEDLGVIGSGVIKLLRWQYHGESTYKDGESEYNYWVLYHSSEEGWNGC